MTLVKVMPQLECNSTVFSYTPEGIIYTPRDVIYDIYSTGVTYNHHLQIFMYG